MKENVWEKLLGIVPTPEKTKNNRYVICVYAQKSLIILGIFAVFAIEIWKTNFKEHKYDKCD